jgi:hypothetical protein
MKPGLKRGAAGLLLGVLALSGAAMWPAEKADSAVAAEFNAGNIIDDGTFTNKDSMSVLDVQNFLNSKVPVCDTNGDKTFTGTYKGVFRNNVPRKNLDPAFPPPYTCVKEYYQNTTTMASNYGGAPVPSGAISAAQIIVNAAQQYNINPQTLLVLIQKESSLITDDWPWTTEYRTATGYGCPDTAACDSQYYGFSNQVTISSADTTPTPLSTIICRAAITTFCTTPTQPVACARCL